jgi:hypothetical protein
MRKLLLLAALTLAACDDFSAVQKANTIEAYEDYLSRHPDGRFDLMARTRLEELYLERARAESSLEGFDAYLARFPEGIYRDKALAEREDHLWAWTVGQGTIEAYEAYLAEYPKADKKRKTAARRAITMIGYAPRLDLSEVRARRVNLAEDPKGPLGRLGVPGRRDQPGRQGLDPPVARVDLGGVVREAPAQGVAGRGGIVAPPGGRRAEEAHPPG